MTPIVKKPGLDPSDLSNLRPITNLVTISKILERLVLARLRPHVQSSPNFSKFQSGFRSEHSTETALIKVTNDILSGIEKKAVTVLLSLDISAAFDALDHNILIDRAEQRFGITDSALAWFRSYLADRKYYVAMGSARSTQVQFTTGVPQGSVLGPFMFAMFVSPIDNVLGSSGAKYHQYADDTQLYIDVQPTSWLRFNDITRCADNVTSWFLENGLLINPTKTDAIVFGPKGLRKKIPTGSVSFAGTSIKFSNDIKLLGVTLDNELSMKKHISEVIKGCNYHIRALRHVRNCMSKQAAETIACGIVGSRLDYCNSLLYGLPATSINRLQRVQNNLARTVCKAPWRSSRTALLHSLHWLPVKQRIQYKMACVTFKCRAGVGPSYLRELVEEYIPSRSLRSSNQLLLTCRNFKNTMASRAFCCSAPIVWNDLSLDARSAVSLETFKKSLKTELFKVAFAPLMD